MTNRTKFIILAVVGAQLIIAISLLALPTMAQALPGRYRVALQERYPAVGQATEWVIQQVAPVATALPAPSQANNSNVDIAALINEPAVEETAVSTATPQPTATPKAQPTTTAQEQSTPEPTATPLPSPTPIPTPTPLPERIILEGMGSVRQSFNNCGPANLTQVLNWYGYDITQEAVASYLKPNSEDRNVSPWQIADYVNEQTFNEFRAITRSNGTLELIKQFIAAGYPVVIEKGYTLPETGWYGHYLTVYGYDDALQEFYSKDTYLGPFDGNGRVDSYDVYREQWQAFNYTFYVVYRPEQEAEVMDILGPELTDDFTMWQQAAARAEKDTKADPNNPFAWFNLGTALTRMGAITGDHDYYQGGAQAFDRAREIGLPRRMLWYQFEAYLAYWRTERLQDVLDLADATLATQGGRNVEETYLYKGHALSELGRLTEARAAYEEALKVNSNFYPAQIALDWVNSLLNGG